MSKEEDVMRRVFYLSKKLGPISTMVFSNHNNLNDILDSLETLHDICIYEEKKVDLKENNVSNSKELSTNKGKND